MKVIVSRQKGISKYLTACILQLHDNGTVEVEATGSAIEKLVRTVTKLRNILKDIEITDVTFEEVDYNGRKKAKLKVRIDVVQGKSG